MNTIKWPFDKDTSNVQQQDLQMKMDICYFYPFLDFKVLMLRLKRCLSGEGHLLLFRGLEFVFQHPQVISQPSITQFLWESDVLLCPMQALGMYAICRCQCKHNINIHKYKSKILKILMLAKSKSSIMSIFYYFVCNASQLITMMIMNIKSIF